MKTYIYLFFGLLSFSIWANDQTVSVAPLTNKAEISVLTVGSGSELYTLFGHTALRIYDPLLRIDRVYNYGVFDFQTPDFYSKFIKGDLLYFGVYEDYREFVMSYAYEDRPVYEQHLLLDEQQKGQIWQLVNRSVDAEHKFYTYKFIHQNCTTKVVDLLNMVLDKPVTTAVFQEDETFRTVFNESLNGRFFEKLGINLLFSSKLDDKPNLLFLPDKLMLALNTSSIDGVPLVDKTTAVYERQFPKAESWWNSYAFFSALMLVFAFLMKYDWVRSVYFVLAGLMGGLLLFISFYSSHIELAYNDTPLLFNPLFLLLPWGIFARKWTKAVIFIYTLCAVALILFVVLNALSEKLIVTLPLILLTLWALLLQFWKQKK